MKEWDIEFLKDFLYKTYTLAKCQDDCFKLEKYKWELGKHVIFALLADNSKFSIANKQNFKTLYGIRVEENINERNTIKLWKDITL